MPPRYRRGDRFQRAWKQTCKNSIALRPTESKGPVEMCHKHPGCTGPMAGSYRVTGRCSVEQTYTGLYFVLLECVPTPDLSGAGIYVSKLPTAGRGAGVGAWATCAVVSSRGLWRSLLLGRGPHLLRLSRKLRGVKPRSASPAGKSMLPTVGRICLAQWGCRWSNAW